jgi:hypothetical protein
MPEKQKDPLDGLKFTPLQISQDGDYLRRYVSPINILVRAEDGTIIKAQNKIPAGQCQIIFGLGIYPSKITDDEINEQFKDWLFVNRQDLIDFINSKIKSNGKSI